MLKRGAAKKVTIFVNDDVKRGHEALYEAIMMYLLHKGVAGATVTRALAGFGPNRKYHTTKTDVAATGMPLRIEFIEDAAKLDELLPTLYDMVEDGLIEVQDTTVVRAANKARPAPAAAPHLARRRGPAKLLRVFLGESDRCDDEPLFATIVKRLRLLEIGGATVYRGILGYGVKRHTHKPGFLHLGGDLPIMISVVDTEEKIRQAAEAVEPMLVDGLIVISDVDMVRVVRSLPQEGAAG